MRQKEQVSQDKDVESSDRKVVGEISSKTTFVGTFVRTDAAAAVVSVIALKCSVSKNMDRTH